jgi:hypothetical protein
MNAPKRTKVQPARTISLLANIGIIPYEEKGYIGNKKPEDPSKCKIVKRETLLPIA